jgi:hypothetical protein
MSIRKLALVGLAVAIYVHCRGDHSEPAKPAAPMARIATTTAALHDNPNRADLIVLRAAMTRLRKIDITVGELRLEGQAVDDKTQPIGGATITLNHQRTVVAEADGTFAFDELAPGDYELTAEKGPYYGEDKYTLGEKTDPEVITLLDGPTLVLHVADHAGTPVLGAKVSPRNHLDAYTDRDGMVKVRGMELGNDKLDIVASGYATEHIAIDLGDDPRRTIDKKVVLQPSAPIGGVVLDQDDKPVAHAQVNVSSSTHGWSDSTEADEHGQWKLLGFGAGKLTLSASSDIDVATPAPVVPIDGTTPRLDLVIRVERGATIDGMVVDEANHPVVGVSVNASGSTGDSDAKGHFHIVGLAPGKASISAATDTLGTADQEVDVPRGGHVDVRLVMVVSSIAGVVTDERGQPIADATVFASGAGNAGDRTNELGHFDLKGVPPGDYELTATRRDESVFSDAPGVPVHSGNRHVALVIPDSASITGHVVLDGQPVDYFGVVVTPDPERVRTTPEPTRSPDGRFTQSELRPGTMAVVLVGPSFARKVIENVVVTAGKQTDLGEIAVTAGTSLHGHVVDGSGQPVADAVVVVRTGDRIENDISLDSEVAGGRGTRTDASGHFEISGLTDDLSGLQIQASDPERGLALPRELTAADLDHEISLVIAATGSLAGEIVDNPPDLNYFVKVTSTDGRAYSVFSGGGDFAIDQLPPGDYLASLDQDLVLPLVAFHIVAGQTTTISFTHPPTLITVNITIVGDRCTGVVFAAPDAVDVVRGGKAPWIAMASCTDPQHAMLEHVAPGRYQLCNSSCTVVDIASGPDRQTVTLTEPSDEPPPTLETTETPADPTPTPDPAEPDPPAEADEGASTAE